MIDRMLDRIEVMLLKLREDDPYKEALESEYHLFRSVLEALPRDVNLPDRLYSSVFSLEQRLNYYVILGKSNNPLVELAPTLHAKIASENEKAALLALVNSNASYIANKKTKLEVLKAFLNRINFDGELKDIASTIELVEKEYVESGVYSNEFEKEITKAKYLYMIKLILANEIELADTLCQTFSYDMVWFIYNRHVDNVHRLIDDGKPSLAKVLSDFLTELPKDKEKDIEFWKVLAQIEDPNYEQKVEAITVSEDTDITIQDQEHLPAILNKHKFTLSANFLKRKRKAKPFVNRFLKNHQYSFEMNETMVKISIFVSNSFEMERKELDDLCSLLEKSYRRNHEAFSNVYLEIYAQANEIGELYSVPFRTIISKITTWALLKSIVVYAQKSFHVIPEGFLNGCMFEKIELNNGEWEFGKHAFSDNVLLQKVVLDNIQITKLGDYAFANCPSLKEVMLPLSMENYSMGVGTFCGCTSLETVYLPSSIIKIRKKTFMNCKKLESIGIHSIIEVEESGFEGCESFSAGSSFNIDPNNGGLVIGARAFYGCKALTSFSFTKGSRVGDYAFAYSGLESATLSVLFRTSGVGVFMGSKLKKIDFSGELAIPAEFFKDCKELVSVSFNEDTMILGNKVFSGCTSLRMIDSSFSYIGDSCFKDCILLREIKLSPATTKIGKKAFYNCQSITSISLPVIETITEEMFSHCSSLEEIIFSDPDKNPIRVIEDRAFEGCSRLRNFDFHEGLRIIGAAAFYETDLVEVDLPDTVLELGPSAFAKCDYLKKVRLSIRLKVINDRVFYGCYSLKTVDMSNSDILDIDAFAFAGCESLTEISLGKAIRSVEDNAFDEDNAITTITLPTAYFYECDGSESILRILGLDRRYFVTSTTEDSDIKTLILEREL